MQILNPKHKNISSIKKDLYINLDIKQNRKNALFEQNNSFLDQAERYREEKESSGFYRVYGTLNMLSVLTEKRKLISSKESLFNKTLSIDRITFQNYFDMYLCVFEEKINLTATTYKNTYRIITNKKDLDVYRASFSKNIFGETVWNFNFNTFFDFENQNEVCLYFALKTETVFKNDVIDGEVGLLSDGTILTEAKKEIVFQIDSQNIKFTFDRFYKITIKERDENTGLYLKKDYMFVNGKRYVYNNIIFKVLPDKSDIITKNLYDDFIKSYDGDNHIYDDDKAFDLC